MASRTKQKEMARARRLEQEAARAQSLARARNIKMLGGIVVLAIAVVAVFIAISSSGSSGGKGLQKGPALTQTQTAVAQLLSGIPQSANVLGNPSAPVTVDYYGDLECPVCREFTLGVAGGGWPQFVANDVRSGKAKVVYRAFQTATQDPVTFQTQQVAALAAGRQNLFWNYVELFYHEQGTEDTGYVTENYLTGLAQQVPGLSLSKWQTARKDATLLAQVQSDEQSGTTAGVSGTPTVIFQGPKGKATPSTGIPSYSDLQTALKQVS
jgi:protein-disulfide isomerase